MKIDRRFRVTLILLWLVGACAPVTNNGSEVLTDQDAAPVTVTEPSEAVVDHPCVGAPLKDRMCTTDYTPVCGCNGRTYSNACVARVAGVLKLTPGQCSDDKSGLD